MTAYYAWYLIRRRIHRALSLTFDFGYRGYVHLQPELKLEDLWIGAFWRLERSKFNNDYGTLYAVDVWICLVPCVPLHISWNRWEDEVPF